MNKKELESRKKALLKDLDKEKQKKKNNENKLSLYEYKEKQQVKKSKPQIPMTQRHVVVDAEYFETNYDYDKRRKEWHQKAGHNADQLVCSRCKDDDNWETILLDDGRHICYYCWIKKPDELKKSSKTSSSAKKVKASSKSTSSAKKVNSSKSVKKASYSLYSDYDADNRSELWDKYVTTPTKPVECDICESTNNDEVVILDNNDKVCYYCWFKEPSRKEIKKEMKKEANEVSSDKEEGPGKLFWILTIVSGILLITLLVVLSLGIISGFTFTF